jgi:hypothetical protein
MIPLDKLKPHMICKYISSVNKNHTPVYLIILSIKNEGPSTDIGPEVRNYESGYPYGIVRQIEYFHKWNTSHEKVVEALTQLGSHL